MSKVLFILAGGNGSGKTSFYNANQKIFGSVPFVNADILLRDNVGNNDVLNAPLGQKMAMQKIEQLLEEGVSFCFETVFSHESKIELITKAKALGYAVSLYYCHLDDPSLNVMRVSVRVEEGGHNVPLEKIFSRIPRTFEFVKRSLILVDSFFLMDNSEIKGHCIVAEKLPKNPIKVMPGAPKWVSKMLAHMPLETKPKIKTKPKVAAGSVYKMCIRCRRALRGESRKIFGICSKCEPIIR